MKHGASKKGNYMSEINFTQEDYYSGEFEIAREGYWSYDTEGYVALVKDGRGYIVHASHCSCYGTWEAGDLNFRPIEWEGSIDDMIKLAKAKGDLNGLLQRPLDPAMDYGVATLLSLYDKIIKWDENGRK